MHKTNETSFRFELFQMARNRLFRLIGIGRSLTELLQIDSNTNLQYNRSLVAEQAARLIYSIKINTNTKNLKFQKFSETFLFFRTNEKTHILTTVNGMTRRTRIFAVNAIEIPL